METHTTDNTDSLSEQKSIRKSESFTSLILRSLPSCWRRLRPEDVESDDGGFSDHHLRSKRVKVTEEEEEQLSLDQPLRRGLTSHSPLRAAFSNPIQDQGRSLAKHRRLVRKTGKYSLNPPVLAREFYSEKKLLQHYSSCHTFRPFSSGSYGQVVYRRPHSVDLGGVGRARLTQSQGYLQQEFRRVGIGTCLEGESPCRVSSEVSKGVTTLYTCSQSSLSRSSTP